MSTTQGRNLQTSCRSRKFHPVAPTAGANPSRMLHKLMRPEILLHICGSSGGEDRLGTSEMLVRPLVPFPAGPSLEEVEDGGSRR
nr:uncharacterized protein CTRU02_11633 [Colletotrichum truncatum]KAF6785648.1 hypothetical protein CTRU02_11633 [Colletotrichum truncatum]